MISMSFMIRSKVSNIRVHGHVMMNAVHQEMQREHGHVVREVIVEVEEEAVQGILQDSPDKVTEEEACRGLSNRGGGNGSHREES